MPAPGPRRHPALVRTNLRNSPTRRSLLGALGSVAAGAALTSCGVPAAYVAPE
ncbi:spermidine/putrescine ABC transporter substrate-binding protein, partial [Streptomyces sp. KAI-27]|nr:spermidine/putrescine ABC transporter substrate-binding protein [Streptomyces sp. KAI-27]